MIGVCSKLNRNFVLECGASVVLTYNDEGYDIIEKIEAEALENGKFHIVLDCVSSADSRDSKPGKVVEGLGIMTRDLPMEYYFSRY